MGRTKKRAFGGPIRPEVTTPRGTSTWQDRRTRRRRSGTCSRHWSGWRSPVPASWSGRSRRAMPCTTGASSRGRRRPGRVPPARRARDPAPHAVHARRGSTRSASRARRSRRPNCWPGGAAARRGSRRSDGRGHRRSTPRASRSTAMRSRSGGSGPRGADCPSAGAAPADPRAGRRDVRPRSASPSAEPTRRDRRRGGAGRADRTTKWVGQKSGLSEVR